MFIQHAEAASLPNDSKNSTHSNAHRKEKKRRKEKREKERELVGVVFFLSGLLLF